MGAREMIGNRQQPGEEIEGAGENWHFLPGHTTLRCKKWHRVREETGFLAGDPSPGHSQDILGHAPDLIARVDD